MQRESKTLATITFQNYFRLYNKLSGMTGTALTEEEEFADHLQAGHCGDPHQPARAAGIDDPGRACIRPEQGKFRAVIRQVEECHDKGQPVLVGTVSIEKNRASSQDAAPTRASRTTC